MLEKLLPVLLLLMVFIPSPVVTTAAGDNEEIMDYKKTRQKVVTLWKKRNYQKAIKIYEKALPRFPDKTYEITISLARLYLNTKEYEKCLDIFEYGLKRKVMYPIWPESSSWKPLREYERYTKIFAENTRLQAEATAKSAPRLKVIPPENVSKEKKYPLIIVLHGWNGSLETLDKQWESTLIRRQFFLALVQSSQVIRVNRFGWNDVQLGRKDVKNMYKKIIEEYPVDTQRVIIAGFSQGGNIVLDIAVNNIIPVIGFVTLQPGLSLVEDFDGEILKQSAARGLRGTIIASKKPETLQEQEKMAALVREIKAPYRYVILGTTHWYPAGFREQLDIAVQDILTSP